MKNYEEELKRFEKAFDELSTKVCILSSNDLNPLGDERADTSAADRVRTVALKAAGEYRKRGEPLPPHVVSAMSFMPLERGTESLNFTVNSTNDDRLVRSRPVPGRRPDMYDTQASTLKSVKKQWTLMFFFASDNLVSPSMLSQIKAIKAAGSQVDTNVLAYFDPNEHGAPTRVLEIDKDQAPTIADDSDSSDPVTSVFSSDYVSPHEIRKWGQQSKEFSDSLQLRSDELKTDMALEHFLGFCGEAYPAEHYMLFFVGHGLVVGRDAFLPDDNPDSAIGLKTIGNILKKFKYQTGDGALELIGMDNCSMSAVEVAYELKGTANYMLASQGVSFVGSWPYRQLLTKIYHDVEQQGDLNILELVKGLHTLCIQHSIDLMHAGYSSDLSLCSLDPKRVEALTGPISTLSQALQSGVTEPRCRDLIVLAHWKSQSYWQETYTDLYDFCLSLRRLCQELRNEQSGQSMVEPRRGYDMNRIAIINACEGVMNVLKPENGNQLSGPVVSADYVGPDVQYSHGLSIYFPWSRPPQDDKDHVINNYEGYAFTTNVGPQTWLGFLDTYFDKTKRLDRIAEELWADSQNVEFLDPGFRQWLETARKAFPAEGKIIPPDSGGGACVCASTKNHSRVFSMSPGVWRQYSMKGSQKRMVFALEEDLTPQRLEHLLLPYLNAVNDIQRVIDEVKGKPSKQLIIKSIQQRSPLSVNVDGVSDAIRLISEIVVPWRRKHAANMLKLAEKEKKIEIEIRKAEVLERKARAVKDNTEADRNAAEASKIREEVRALRLENEKQQIELERARVQLALDLPNKISPRLSEGERSAYANKLLPALGVITSSDLEIVSSSRHQSSLEEEDYSIGPSLLP